MADGNPFAPVYMNPNASRTGLWDLRMMAAANRAEQPFMRGSHWGHQGIAGDPLIGGLAAQANQPDYSQFTYDPAMRQQAIAAGVHPLEASQVQRNAILPNTGFFGAHPRLSGALEGGIFGALASHGGDTPGESIQGALEGLVGGQRIRQGMLRQQFARPFESNEMLEHLRDMQANRLFREAQVKHIGDESEIQQRRIEEQRQRDQIAMMRIDATRPVPVEGGTYVYKGEGGPPSIGPDMLVNANMGGWQFEGGPGRPRAGGQGSDFNQEIARMNAERKAAGKPPMTAQEVMQARSQWGFDRPPEALVGVTNEEGGTTFQAARPGTKIAKGKTLQTPSQMGAAPEKAAKARQDFILKAMQKPWEYNIDPGDKDMVDKLGKLYDVVHGGEPGGSDTTTQYPVGHENNPQAITKPK